MGYNVKPGVVNRYADTLESIKRALDSGNDATFTVAHPAHLSRLRDQLHWFLRCAKIFPEEAQGRYADLRDRCTISVDWEQRCVLVQAKSLGKRAPSLAQSEAMNEHDVLLMLSKTTEDLLSLSFTPSKDYKGDEWLAGECLKHSYKLSILEFGEDDGPLAGTKSYTAKRTRSQSDGAFGILGRYKAQ